MFLNGNVNESKMFMDLNELKQQVYDASRNAMALLTVATVIKCPCEYRNQLLNDVIEISDEQRLTPLMIAARYGHENVVRCLMSQFHVNMEVEGILEVGDKLIEGVTALWCAAEFGYLNIVKLLVKAGADVNHSTCNGSSPLRAACFNNRIDIVMFLVNHNADVNLTNDVKNSILMLAAAKGYYNMALYLIKCGANVNEQSIKGNTALHFAAEFGNHNIIELLMRNGAKIIPNAFNMTPILVAAERSFGETVQFFVEFCPKLSRLEIIEAFELLGASYANDNRHYSISKAYENLVFAMNLRYDEYQNLVIKKVNLLPPIYDYLNHKECENLNELEMIRGDDDKLHMEGLVVRERILGQNNFMLTFALIFRGAIFADRYIFDACLNLWLRAMRINFVNNEPAYRDILRFAQIFSQMVSNDFNLSFNHFKQVIEGANFELQRSNQRLEKAKSVFNMKTCRAEMEMNLMSCLYLINIFTKISNQFGQEEVIRIETIIFKIVKKDLRLRDGQSLLHLAVTEMTHVDDFHTNSVCKFPCSKTTELLIKCGADVNSMTLNRSTPLHHLVNLTMFEHVSTVENIVVCLYNAGAHLDTVNIEGKSPLDGSILVHFHFIVKLKCLAAQTIVKKCVQYRGFVPKALEAFIELHGIASQSTN